jgi:hypothetical protein
MYGEKQDANQHRHQNDFQLNHVVVTGACSGESPSGRAIA